MKWTFTLQVVSLLLVNTIYCEAVSQELDSDPLIKEVVEQSRNPGEEWANDRKRSYQYDAFGNQILDRLTRWSEQSQSWSIQNEEFTAYDTNGNRILIESINYLAYPEELSNRREVRKYENGLIKYRNIEIQESNSSNSDSLRVYEVYYEYNENGDRTQFTVHYNANLEFRGGYGYRWYFDDHYCETAFVDYNIDINESEIVTDSISTSRDSWCNITQQSKYEFSQGYYDLYSDTKYEYEYDDNGNILTQVEYQRSKSYEEWVKQIRYSITYTLAGKRASILQFNYLSNGEISQSMTYDAANRLLQLLIEIKESPEADWILDVDSKWHYNDFNQLDKEESSSDWNQIAKEFRNTIVTEYSYDSENNNTRTVSERILDGNRTRNEDNREFRCDGPIVLEILKTRNYINGSIIVKEKSTQFSYFKRAPCEAQNTTAFSFNIYPNPTNDYFQIYSEEIFGNATLKLLNSNGEMVKKQNEFIDNYFSMDVSALEPGLYIVQIESDLGQLSQKFIKR